MTEEIVFGPEEITHASIICPDCNAETIIALRGDAQVPDGCLSCRKPYTEAAPVLLETFLETLRSIRSKPIRLRVQSRPAK